MRINKFLAQTTGMSRRAADQVIADGKVLVNEQPASTGHNVVAGDVVHYDNKNYSLADLPQDSTTILMHKPVGYVVSRDGQGSRTVYDLLQSKYHNLKPIGRLDKDSSGLLLLTDDGDLANRLTHPKYQKTKRYQVRLDTALQPLHRQMISDYGITLEDGPSRLELERQTDGDDTAWAITMKEGRNRQIRRTFAALGYTVTRLQRTDFGDYHLGDVAAGAYRVL